MNTDMDMDSDIYPSEILRMGLIPPHQFVQRDMIPSRNLVKGVTKF
jgi:hypothetical protein